MSSIRHPRIEVCYPSHKKMQFYHEIGLLLATDVFKQSQIFKIMYDHFYVANMEETEYL